MDKMGHVKCDVKDDCLARYHDKVSIYDFLLDNSSLAKRFQL